MKKLGLSRLGVFLLISGFMLAGAVMILVAVTAGRFLDEILYDPWDYSVGEVSVTVYNMGYDDNGATNVNVDEKGPTYSYYESPGYVEFDGLEPGVYTMTYMFEGERHDVEFEIVEKGGYISVWTGIAIGDIHGRAVVLSGKGPSYDKRAEHDELFRKEYGL